VEAAEFDKFADEYLAIHTENLKLSGEKPDYFARYKIDELRRRWTREKRPEPRAILDFGSGVGASLPHLARAFPTAALTAIDVSERSLEISKARYPELGRRVLYSGAGELPLEAGGFDLIFTACVFHHIDAEQHVELFTQLRKRLRPGGVFVVWEHNPVNPVTRYIVATCPFDENAVLIPGPVLKSRLRAAGFPKVDVRYTGFFPHALAALRPAEPWLAWLPVGAQHYALAVA
jgi:SAM-dependent methyltransferase